MEIRLDNLYVDTGALRVKLIIIHFRTQKQRQVKTKPSIKLNHNTSM